MNEAERLKVAIALREDERAYLDHLQFISVFFYSPVQASSSSVPKDDQRLLFSTFQDIVQVHSAFVDQLDLALDLWCSLSELGHVFKELMPSLPLYLEFKDNEFVAKEVLQRHLRRERATKVGRAQAAMELLSEKGKITYVEMIDMIATRLPRYTTFLQRLLDCTPPGHTDVPKLQEILGCLNASIEDLSTKARDAEEVQKMFAVQRRIDKSIHGPFRRFEHEGPLKKIAPQGMQARHWFLFSDVIVHAKAKGSNTFSWRSETHLATAWLRDLPDSRKVRNAFQIVAPDRTFTVLADFAEEKQLWMHKIHRLISEHVKARPTLLSERGRVTYKPKKGIAWGYIDPAEYDPMHGKDDFIAPWEPATTQAIAPKVAQVVKTEGSTASKNDSEMWEAAGTILPGVQNSGTKLAKLQQQIKDKEAEEERVAAAQPSARRAEVTPAPPPPPATGKAEVVEVPTAKVYDPSSSSSSAGKSNNVNNNGNNNGNNNSQQQQQQQQQQRTQSPAATPASQPPAQVTKAPPPPVSVAPASSTSSVPAPPSPATPSSATANGGPAPVASKMSTLSAPNPSSPSSAGQAAAPTPSPGANPAASEGDPSATSALTALASALGGLGGGGGSGGENGGENGGGAPRLATATFNRSGGGDASPAAAAEDARNCLKCGLGVPGDAVSLAQGQIILHRHCFACFRCDVPLAGQQFSAKRGKPLCKECYIAEHAPPCGSCGGPVAGESLKAGGVAYHPRCFACVTCGTNLADVGFFRVDGKAYCAQHHPKLTGGGGGGGDEQPPQQSSQQQQPPQQSPQGQQPQTAVAGGGTVPQPNQPPQPSTGPNADTAATADGTAGIAAPTAAADANDAAGGAKLCGSCQGAIESEAVAAAGLFFHTHCFKCDLCGEAIVDKFVIPKKSGKPVHAACRAKQKEEKKEKKDKKDKKSKKDKGGGGGSD